jgi:hypothetical protein
MLNDRRPTRLLQFRVVSNVDGEHKQAAASAKFRASTVTKSSRFYRITPVLAGLHWLPIQYRIQFKIAVTTFKVLTTHEPNYLSELVRFQIPTRQLRSSGRNQLHINRVNIAFTERAFCHAAPIVWNSLRQT